MTNATQKQSITKKIAALKEQHHKLLAMPPEKALDLILDAPQPAALVHAMSEEDFYILTQDIGPGDALPILSLATLKQWEFILDVNIWQKDRMNINAVTEWLDLLLQADPQRLVKWCLEQKSDFIEFYLFKTIQFVTREHDQDPSDFGDDFFTHDDMYYVRFIAQPLELSNDGTLNRTARRRFEIIYQFLNHVALYDHVKYQTLLTEVSAVIPAEAEEERLRLRNVRLAEKGFLPFDEAIAIYTPLRTTELNGLAPKSLLPLSAQSLHEVSSYPIELLKSHDLFSLALTAVELSDIFQQIQSEFAGLCNQIISADQKTIRDREELRRVVKKACGYLTIGLERLAGREPKPDINLAAAHLRQRPLAQIFRYGYSQALELKWQAQNWHKNSWTQRQGLALSFWDEKWMGVLGGLFIKKPLFFDGYQTGRLYREFTTLQDIDHTHRELDAIAAVDDLLAMMFPQDLALTPPKRMVTYKNTILSSWVRSYLEFPDTMAAIPLDDFKRFFKLLFADTAAPRKIGQKMKSAYLNWLAQRTGMEEYALSQKFGPILAELFTEIEEEYGLVAPQDLDPRFIPHFFVEPNK